ncbi:hypothetical protein JCM19237_211 [Photobacterium aphoticum]|uniref:Uncharacterized protein n=1 Tax=Photobacterium aphoticum TaxID=754436 RepID=A0A090RKZ5_9GAMM|nr:hypothetical protein JCM19237_211 [Photobacterium aphoticum]
MGAHQGKCRFAAGGADNLIHAITGLFYLIRQHLLLEGVIFDQQYFHDGCPT